MKELVKKFLSLYNSRDFREFQNDFSIKLYDCLAKSYSSADNEVKMVTNICNVINGKHFETLNFYSKKIHGSRSQVEFKNKNTVVQKEMADMVIISVATKEKEIIYEKTAFIQNKKDNGNKWKIDPDQLFLLQNFPTFKGVKGLFGKNMVNEYTFLNHSSTLGNYGLFQSPGEMIIVNANNIFKYEKNQIVSFQDLKSIESSIKDRSSLGPSFIYIDHPAWNDIIIYSLKYINQYISFPHFPFLSNSIISINLYEFIRNWTLFNIGEVVSVLGYIMDNDLSKITKILLKTAGLSNVININSDFADFEDDIVILVAHLNLDEKP